MDGNDDVDMWELYRDYIGDRKEISECNAAFAARIDFSRNIEKNRKWTWHKIYFE